MPRPKPKNAFKEESSIPLSLETHWFIGEKPKFPYPALRELGTILNADYQWESIDSAALDGSMDHIFIGAVIWEDEGSDIHATSDVITKIRVRWNSRDVNRTMSGEVKNIYTGPQLQEETGHTTDGPGKKITGEQLSLAADWYGGYILAYCKGRIGLHVGDGECWTLAYRALEEAGRQALRKDGREPPLLSTGRVHGHLIFEWHASPEYPVTVASGIMQHVPAAPIRAGDILELADGRFRAINLALSGLVKQEENVRFKAHTAVITALEDCTLKVIEQNGRIKSIVAENEYNLRNMVGGAVRIYRPLGVSLVSVSAGRRDVSASLSGVCDKW
ncbi:hypothetical protein McanMca71_005331 [Microsporum canis]|uniref:BBC1/AIM3 cysteine proteinase-fold domain-containing protein n=1 Tax=Arthroderma otae (strain ATCC MYA-4605 / CBS 113480) TaxID=554155 RepID=C5G183_ARTOC|nr:conserved hypothetical protein [Microsporum canis CBS 113480]EEQ28546.1 conserved hypothetical protein [Microsporum canis CBS 113480]